MKYIIKFYKTDENKTVVLDYLNSMTDIKARSRIFTSIEKLEGGKFGNCKRLNEDIWELIINEGKGYRVYYTIYHNEVILLLCAGNKKTQSNDIKKAEQYKKTYENRSNNNVNT